MALLSPMPCGGQLMKRLEWHFFWGSARIKERERGREREREGAFDKRLTQVNLYEHETVHAFVCVCVDIQNNPKPSLFLLLIRQPHVSHGNLLLEAFTHAHYIRTHLASPCCWAKCSVQFNAHTHTHTHTSKTFHSCWLDLPLYSSIQVSLTMHH